MLTSRLMRHAKSVFALLAGICAAIYPANAMEHNGYTLTVIKYPMPIMQINAGSDFTSFMTLESSENCARFIVNVVITRHRNDEDNFTRGGLSHLAAIKVAHDIERVLTRQTTASASNLVIDLPPTSTDVYTSVLSRKMGNNPNTKISNGLHFISDIENALKVHCSGHGDGLLNILGGADESDSSKLYGIQAARFEVKWSDRKIMTVDEALYQDTPQNTRDFEADFRKGRSFTTVATNNQPASPAPEVLEFEMRMGAELTPEVNDGERRFRVGRLLFGGPTHMSGLRSGDIIFNAIDSDLNSTTSVDALYNRLKSSESQNFWILSTRKARPSASIDRFSKKYRVIFPRYISNRSLFLELKSNEDETLLNKTLEMNINSIIRTSTNDRERDIASKLELYSNRKITNILLYLHDGNKSKLDSSIDADLKILSDTDRGRILVSQILGGQTQISNANGYLGLAAQYAVLKGRLIGLCDHPSSEFSITTKEYTVYRNIAGTYYNRVQTGENTKALVVDARFASAVSRASMYGAVDPDVSMQINRFILLQGCDGALLKSVEDNLLRHIEGRDLVKRPKPEIVARSEAAGAVSACETAIQSVRPDTSGPSRHKYCGCFVEGLLINSGFTSYYIDTLKSSGAIKQYYDLLPTYSDSEKMTNWIKSGKNGTFDAGCAHFFESE